MMNHADTKPPEMRVRWLALFLLLAPFAGLGAIVLGDFVLTRNNPPPIQNPPDPHRLKPAPPR